MGRPSIPYLRKRRPKLQGICVRERLGRFTFLLLKIRLIAVAIPLAAEEKIDDPRHPETWQDLASR